MKKQWLIMLCGISGSGKSTWVEDARKTGLKFTELNRDEWTWKLHTNGVADWSKYKFTDAREKAVNEKIEELFQEAVAGLSPIVVSNTNLRQKDHNYWKQKAKSVGYDFQVIYLDITLEEALKRDRKRGALAVGREILFEQWQRWLDITGFKRYKPNLTKPGAVIADLDGTIAAMNGRSPYEYSKVGTDLPRIDIMEMIDSYISRNNYEIIFLSGRDDICKEETKEWIKQHWPSQEFLFNTPQIHMRKTGDTRNDRIVKQEIFWEHIARNYNVVAAFDDRPRVIRLWHDIGIPNVVGVQQGYHEF